MTEIVKEIRPEQISPTVDSNPRVLTRLIAAFIDYLLLMSLSLTAPHLTPDVDLQSLAVLLASILYFTFTNSWLLHGQTIGKRIFSLQVVSTLRAGKLLSIPQSFIRYVLNYGFIIGLAEVLPFVYRAKEFVADPSLLELHMYFALFLTLCTLSLFLLTKEHRSLADILLQTKVIALTDTANESAIDQAPFLVSTRSRVAGICLASAVGALLLWLPGVTMPSSASLLTRNRYLVENRFALRIFSINAERSAIRISAVALKPLEPIDVNGKAITETLLNGVGPETLGVEIIEFHLESLPSKTDPLGNAVNFTVNLKDMSVNNVH